MKELLNRILMANVLTQFRHLIIILLCCWDYYEPSPPEFTEFFSIRWPAKKENSYFSHEYN